VIRLVEKVYEKGRSVGQEVREELKQCWKRSATLPKWDVVIEPTEGGILFIRKSPRGILRRSVDHFQDCCVPAWSEQYRLVGITTLKLDVVLDDVLRYSYNRSRQRWHLLWAQPVLSRSLRQVGNSLLGRGDYGEGRYHLCRHDRVGDLAEP